MRLTKAQRNKLCSRTVDAGFPGKTYSFYGVPTFADGTTEKFRSSACFATWASVSDYKDWRYLDYQHNVDKINMGDLLPIIRVGWNEVVRKVYQQLPTHHFLRTHKYVRGDLTQMPLAELNWQFRMIRCHNEHPNILASAGWLYEHYRRTLPPEVLLIAASNCRYRNGRLVEWGSPGLSHATIRNNGSFERMVRTFRMFRWMAQNKGRVFTQELYVQPSMRDRKYEGIAHGVGAHNFGGWKAAWPRLGATIIRAKGVRDLYLNGGHDMTIDEFLGIFSRIGETLRGVPITHRHYITLKDVGIDPKRYKDVQRQARGW